jgi:hypothetical protein
MCSFIDNFLLDSRETIEDDRSCTTFDIVDGSLGNADTDGSRHGKLVEGAEGIRHCDSGWRGGAIVLDGMAKSKAKNGDAFYQAARSKKSSQSRDAFSDRLPIHLSTSSLHFRPLSRTSRRHNSPNTPLYFPITYQPLHQYRKNGWRRRKDARTVSWPSCELHRPRRSPHPMHLSCVFTRAQSC